MTTIKNSLTVFITLFVLVACKSEYVIQSPASGSVHTEVPAQFRITYPAAPASLPRINLNGFDVREHFTVGATEATANGEDFAEYLEEGENSFQINPPAGPTVKFVYDTQGPDIAILGSSIDSAATIHGEGLDKHGLTSLTVNGVTAALGGNNAFSVTLPPSPIYEYQATDTLGHQKTTHYASLGQIYSPSMSLGVSQGVLDAATQQIVNALNLFDLNNAVAGTVLFNATWQGLLGETYGPEVVIQTMDFSAEEAGIDLANGAGGSLYSHNNIEGVLLFRWYNGFLPPIEVDAATTLGPISVTADVNLNVVDNALDVDVGNFSSSTGNLAIAGVNPPFTSLLASISTIFNGVFNVIIAPQLELVFQNIVPLLLETSIRNSYTISIPDFFTGHSLAMALQLDGVSTTDEGLFASLRGSGVPIETNPLVPQPLAGVIYKPDPLPNALLSGGQFAFSLNTNTINQVYASAFAAGLNHVNLSGGQVQYGLPRNNALGGSAANKRVLVDSVVPPKVDIRPLTDGAAINLLTHGMEISSQTKQADGSFKNDFSVRVSSRSSLGLGLNEDGSIDVSFPRAPQYEISAYKLGDGVWTNNAVNATVNTFIKSTIGLVLQEIAKPFANIRMPAFLCVQFTANDISAVGGEQSHLNFSGSFGVNPDCATTPPTTLTAYGRGESVAPYCADNQQEDGGLCYATCPEGYVGDGATCYEVDAALAVDLVEYAAAPSNGFGTKPQRCAPGEELQGSVCYPRCDAGFKGVGASCVAQKKAVYNRAPETPVDVFNGVCEAQHERVEGLCYPRCKQGYSGEGAQCKLLVPSYARGLGSIPEVCAAGEQLKKGRCVRECTGRTVSVFDSCVAVTNRSVSRGTGASAQRCASGYEFQAGVCYRQCAPGYRGEGNVCRRS